MEKITTDVNCVYCGKIIFKKLAEPEKRLWCLCPLCIQNCGIFKKVGGGLVVIHGEAEFSKQVAL